MKTYMSDMNSGGSGSGSGKGQASSSLLLGAQSSNAYGNSGDRNKPCRLLAAPHQSTTVGATTLGGAGGSGGTSPHVGYSSLDPSPLKLGQIAISQQYSNSSSNRVVVGGGGGGNSSRNSSSNNNGKRGVSPTPQVQALSMYVTTPANAVDYRTFKFKPLDPLSHIKFDAYVGPTPESNWVIPGALLVGAFPASADDAETFELLSGILKLGATKFVCLQLEYRENVTESMWRSGQAIRPYFQNVKILCKNRHRFEAFQNCNIVPENKVSFVHFPIKDCGVTDDVGVLKLCRDLVKAISEGEVLYIHCWGGHGRTGTIVSIMLHLMYGLDPGEAMRRCQTCHDLRKYPVEVGSPQTQQQRDQVTRIILNLMTLAEREADTFTYGTGVAVQSSFSNNAKSDSNDDFDESRSSAPVSSPLAASNKTVITSPTGLLATLKLNLGFQAPSPSPSPLSSQAQARTQPFTNISVGVISTESININNSNNTNNSTSNSNSNNISSAMTAPSAPTLAPSSSNKSSIRTQNIHKKLSVVICDPNAPTTSQTAISSHKEAVNNENTNNVNVVSDGGTVEQIDISGRLNIVPMSPVSKLALHHNNDYNHNNSLTPSSLSFQIGSNTGSPVGSAPSSPFKSNINSPVSSISSGNGNFLITKPVSSNPPSPNNKKVTYHQIIPDNNSPSKTRTANL